MITDLYYAEHSMIDPNTEATQIIGRFRKENGVFSIIHITNLNPNIPVWTKENLQLYLQIGEKIYNKIKELCDTTTNHTYKLAYKEAMGVVPFAKYMKDNGAKNYFAIDNYMDEEIVRGYYKNEFFLIQAYENSNHFIVEHIYRRLPLGDIERLKRERNHNSLKEKNIETIRQLKLLNYNKEYDSEILREYRNELYQYNPFIVEAYELLGKEQIEQLKYSRPRIRERMILKQYENGTTQLGFQQMIDNSFWVGQRYSCTSIKAELERIYKLFGIQHKKTITGASIKLYFYVRECKMKGKRGYIIISRK